MEDDNTLLSADSLAVFLKDKVFVEYFNSFLLLPIFSSHVFFDEVSGSFQQILRSHGNPYDPAELAANDGQLTASALHEQYSVQESSLFDLLPHSVSNETLYLTDEDIGAFLDPQQVWQWVIQHRLQLFIKSDLYSEYQLCNCLRQSSKHFIEAYLRRQKCNLGIAELELKTSRDTDSRGHSLKQRPPSSSRHSRHSVSLPILPDSPSRRSNTGRSASAQRRPSTSRRFTKLEREVDRLMSKSGMGKFRKFLTDKTGLKNLLYCIDVIHLKSSTTDEEKCRWFKELKERYFVSASPLSLPVDIIGSGGNGSVTMVTVTNVANIMLKGLTDYWFPRFLLHILPDNLSSVSSLPSLSYTHHDEFVDHTPHPSKVPTPTFRHASSSRSAIRPKPSTRPRTSSTPAALQMNTQYSTSVHVTKPISVPVSKSSSRTRLVWSRESITGDNVKYTELAKYNPYPIVPSDRTSTSNIANSGPSACNSDLYLASQSEMQILSVAGTPVALEDCQHDHRQDLKLFMKCLAVEKRKCGGYFQNYLESLQEKVPLHCLLFWRDVQEYKMLFAGSEFNPLVVEMKARVIYSQYMLDCSTASISCSSDIQCYIGERLWPAYEDIFDQAEEYVLSVLRDHWIELCERDRKIFEQIQLMSRENIGTATVFELDKLSEEYLSSTGVSSSVSSTTNVSPFPELTRPQTDGTASPPTRLIDSRTGDVTVGVAETDEAPHPSTGGVQKEMNLSDIMTNPKEFEFFKIFLNENHAAVDLMCWLEIEAFRALPSNDLVVRNMKAKQIREKYFNKSYFFGANSPVTKEIQREVVRAGGSHKLPARPKSPVIREAQKHVRSRLEKKWIPLFVRSDGFLDRQGIERGDKTRKDSNDTTSLLVYSESHETLQLKKALYNQKDCDLFKEYMNIQAPQGSRPASNVDFWLEIQRFKNMFHSQMNRALLTDKMKAIISCYISRSKLQIAVPDSVADELLKKGLGPYMFREAQNSVFRYLQNSWQEYQSFCSQHQQMSLRQALVNMREEIERQRREAEEMATALKLKEETNRTDSVLLFETEAERQARKAKLRDLKEFGEVSVAFRLSTPHPSYTYCGQIVSLQRQLHPHEEQLSVDDINPVSETGQTGFQKPSKASHAHVRFQSRPTSAKALPDKPVYSTRLTGRQRAQSEPGMSLATAKVTALQRKHRQYSCTPGNRSTPAGQLITNKFVSVKS